MPTDVWNPEQYERFRLEREQPFRDLLRLVVERPRAHAVDLGCGTGELTVALHRGVHAAETLGVDSSPAMLERAAQLEVPGVRFERADIAHWMPRDQFELVFSNAALQWVPDHPALFARLATMVAPGGMLAVQVPANFDHPSHTVAAQLAREEPFRTALGGTSRTSPVLAPEAYSELLHRLGFVEQHVRLQVYAHQLASTDEVVEWVSGTLLTSYAARLPAALYEEFLPRYRARLLAELGEQRPYLYPFKRILMVASRT